LLWPFAWLWAYSKPVFHQMAYGTDRIEHGPVASPDAPPPDTTRLRPGQAAHAATDLTLGADQLATATSRKH
jgi:hypothetical protein